MVTGGHNKYCPKCSTRWYSAKAMPDELRESGHYEGRDCEDVAKQFGWTEENDLRFPINHHGVYCMDCDRIVQWKCHTCEGVTQVVPCDHKR